MCYYLCVIFLHFLMKKQKFANLILGVVFVVVLMMSGVFSSSDSDDVKDEFNAEIVRVISSTETNQTLEVKLQEGPMKDQVKVIENDELYTENKRIFKEGDEVVVVHLPEQEAFYISEYQRFNQLLYLFILFIVVSLLITGTQGVGALIGMGLSFLVIFKLVLPLILAGNSPVLVAILGAALIIPLTFYPSHGISKKTNIAVVSTLVTLVIAGLLATFFADYSHLTGLASEELIYLKIETFKDIDFQGLVLAGILISILGILDDITISQASIVQQLKLAKKNIQFPELFSRAMAVGRDHIASLVNTLILVYAGASLPLLLLFMDHENNFKSVMNLEFIAQDVVSTLIGSIALILAVPITTLLAAFTSTKGVKVEEHHFH